MKTKQNDNRPRFGWTATIDHNPQFIYEHRREVADRPRDGFNRQAVAVIPLPFMSAKRREKVRAFAKTLWPD